MVKDVIEINIGSGGGGGNNKTLQVLLLACNPALLYAYGTLDTRLKTEIHCNKSSSREFFWSLCASMFLFVAGRGEVKFLGGRIRFSV